MTIKSLIGYLLPHHGGSPDKNENIFLGIFSLFIISFLLPVSPVLNNIFLWSLVIYCFITPPFSETIRTIRGSPVLLLISGFFLLHLASALTSSDIKEAGEMILLRAPLFFVPFSIGTFKFSQRLKHKMLALYSLAVLTASILCLGNAIRLFVIFHDASYLYNDWLSDVIGIQSVYFSQIVTLAIISITYLTVYEKAFHDRKIMAITSIVFLMLVQFLLASRVQLIFFYLSLLILLVYYFAFKQGRMTQTIIVLFAVAVIGLTIMNAFPKTVNRFNDLRYPKYAYASRGVQSHYNMPVTSEQWNSLNLRLAIWNCGWELFKQRPFNGYPLGDKRVELRNSYKQKNFVFAYERNFNMHNTYLDVIMTFGLLGIIIFLMGYFVLPILYCISNRDVFNLMIIVSFFFSLITETYIDRRIGCILMGLFFALVINVYKTPTGSFADRVTPR